MKYSTYFQTILFCIFCLQMNAQSAILDISNISINGSNVSFDVNIEASGADLYLGNSDFVISFNTSAFSNPSLAMSDFGTFVTESNSAGDASSTRDNYYFNTATSVSSDRLIINLSGPNPSNTLTFDRRVAKFPDGNMLRLGSFEISGYQGGEANLGWIEASTLVSNISSVDFSESQVPIVTQVTLPVELIFFNAELASRNDVKLVWMTAVEINNDGFEVEHSRDGINWSELSFIQGAGTIESFQNYEYLHHDAPVGDNYYRLKQIDFNGVFEYSNVEVVQVSKVYTIQRVKIYPNPTVDTISIELSEASVSGDIVVFDAQGKIVLNKAVDFNSDKEELSLGHLPTGTYLVGLQVDGQLQTSSVILQR